MTEYNEYALKCHYRFIHNTMGHFFRGIAGWFAHEFLDEMNDVIIGTYDKAVQHYENRKNDAGERYLPKPPFVVFNPLLDFQPESQVGRFLYQYPTHLWGFAARQWKPNIYEDDNVLIAPVLNRYRGSFEIIVFCRSIYEAIDVKIKTLQWFTGGEGRIIYPKLIESQLIIPDELRYFTYKNPYKEETYPLNWENNKSEAVFIKTLNSSHLTFPFSIRPWLKLLDVSDGNELYGGDGLASHKLNINIEWECNIPTHMVLVSTLWPMDNIPYKMDFKINSGYVWIPEYIENGYAPEDIMATYCCDETEDTCHILNEDYVYKDRYTYILTQTDITNLEDDTQVEITLPTEYKIVDYIVKVFHNSGPLEYGFDYYVETENKIKIIPRDFKRRELYEDDIIMIILYEKQQD